MRTYRLALALGFLLAVLLGVAALAGYGVVLYYNWAILLLVLLVLALPILKRQRSAIAYLCAVLILAVSSVAGAFGGHWGRRLQSRIKCQACEPLLTLVQNHRDEHGQFPTSFTRLYVYGWSSDTLSWKYDKLVWTFGLIEDD